MMQLSSVIRRNTLHLTNVHFWILVTISITLIILYLSWPWRGWADGNYWQYPYFFEYLARWEFRYHIAGSLFLIPILYGTVTFWWKGTLIALILAIPGIVPLLPTWHGFSLLINISVLLLPLAVVIIISLELKRQAHERRIFLEREKERQLFLEKILEAQEGERKRISQELHDETIQTLSVVANQLENTLPPNFDERKIKNTKEIVIKTINNLRRISSDLTPAALDQLGLVSALSWIINQATKDSETVFRFILLGEERKLSSKLEINVFRIVQEALTNIKRHSKAVEAEVILEFKDKQLNITVKDDGQGFAIDRVMGSIVTQNKLGLIGMRERVKMTGGILKIQSEEGQGTALSIAIPYN